MNLKDVNIQSEYNSISDNVYDDFFNKVLKQSKSYYRLGGKFTSKNFALCAEGLQEFIMHDGFMKLILIPEFNAEDLDSIDKGIKNPQDIISENWIQSYSEIKDKFVKDHVKALAWMLANDNLEIKIVVPIRRDGSLISNIDLKDSQIFNHKIGFFMEENNQISFSGNIDFEDKIFGEYHNFKVFRSWDDSEKKFIENDFEKFNQYWDGQPIEANVLLKSIALPDAIKTQLVKIAPKSKSEIKLQNIPKLRPYQKEAIDKWFNNNKQGIFEMATGTGKTFTAIGCLNNLVKLKNKIIIVIACPFDNLERQWKKELMKWNFDSDITSGNTKWHQNISDRIATLEINNDLSTYIIITSYKTFSSKKFIDIIENANLPTFLIADEVHNVGSPEYSKGLTNKYDYRLGLSATPERYFDPEGTKNIDVFFKDIVHSLDLKQAIDEKFLVEYYYHPIYADLNDEEYDKYAKYTKVIASLWKSEDPDDQECLKLTLLKRAKVIRDASNKIIEFEKWVKNHNDTKHTLIYCSENQMKDTKSILNKAGIINREITANNPSDPKKRADIIQKFAKGDFHTIVANRILDEGADIPAARICVMLASTGNPKQFIQRRGRVLRKFSDLYPDGSKKEYAEIYDLLIIPKISTDYTDDEIRIERQIVTAQIKRQKYMADIAKNRESCLKDIQILIEKFGIDETIL